MRNLYIMDKRERCRWRRVKSSAALPSPSPTTSASSIRTEDRYLCPGFRIRIRIELFTLMRIRILLLIKVIGPLLNHCEPTGLYCELLNFGMDKDKKPPHVTVPLMRIWIQLFTLMRIRILLLIKVMGSWPPGLNLSLQPPLWAWCESGSSFSL